MENSPSCAHVLQRTLNLVSSRCCLADDGKETYQLRKCPPGVHSERPVYTEDDHDHERGRRVRVRGRALYKQAFIGIHADTQFRTYLYFTTNMGKRTINLGVRATFFNVIIHLEV